MARDDHGLDDETAPLHQPEEDFGYEPPTRPASPQDAQWPRMLPATPPPPSSPRRQSVLALVALGVGCVVVAVALLALLLHGNGTTALRTTTVTQPSGTVPPSLSSPTVAPAATSAPVTCATLGTFAHAGPATTHSDNFADVAFPADSVGISFAPDTESGGYQHRLLSICSPDFSPDTLKAAMNQSLVAKGWAQTQPQANDEHADCGTMCWKKTTPSIIATSTAQITRFIGLRTVTGIRNIGNPQGVVTYVLELTIAPFTSGTRTINAANPDFSMDLASTVDLHWAGSGQIQLPNAALAALIPQPADGFDAIHFSDLRQIPGYKGDRLTQEEQKISSSIALKGNAGHLSKLLVTQSDQSQFTFQWVTYAFGF
jgi:hypothetical protein